MIGAAEMATYRIKDDTSFIVLATDGVWEFLTSQAVVDLVHPSGWMSMQHVPRYSYLSICLADFQGTQMPPRHVTSLCSR